METISLLLVEDNEENCERFRNCIKTRKNVKLVGITNSSNEALDLTKVHSPNAVILDLELHDGDGSGYTYLREIQKLNMKERPIIAVNTNKRSEKIYSKLESLTDFIFFKKQKNYSEERVLDDIVYMGLEDKTEESEELNKKAVKKEIDELPNIINKELDYMGISPRLRGREYIYESIYYLIKEKTKSSFQNYLARKYKISSAAVNRAIQTAINETWRNTDPDEILEKYTAKVNYNTGVPIPTEIVYHLTQKIKNNI